MRVWKPLLHTVLPMLAAGAIGYRVNNCNSPGEKDPTAPQSATSSAPSEMPKPTELEMTLAQCRSELRIFQTRAVPTSDNDSEDIPLDAPEDSNVDSCEAVESAKQDVERRLQACIDNWTTDSVLAGRKACEKVKEFLPVLENPGVPCDALLLIRDTVRENFALCDGALAIMESSEMDDPQDSDSSELHDILLPMYRFRDGFVASSPLESDRIQQCIANDRSPRKGLLIELD